MKYLAIILLTFVIGACTAQTNTNKPSEKQSFTVVKTEAEWKEQPETLFLTNYFFLNVRESELTQYLNPVWVGPSLKTCPR